MSFSTQHLPTFPKIELNLTTNGITLQSDRLINGRFLPFEIAGRCRACRSDAIEADFICSAEAVHVYCARLKGGKARVQLDRKFDPGDVCLFRIRNKGRICNLEHSFGHHEAQPSQDAEAENEKDQNTQMEFQRHKRKESSPAPKGLISDFTSQKNAEAEKFFNDLNANTDVGSQIESQDNM